MENPAVLYWMLVLEDIGMVFAVLDSEGWCLFEVGFFFLFHL